MVMTITIDMFGETELQRTLLRIEKAAEDMSPAFKVLHTQFLEIEKEQFESGGRFSPEGKWAPLADSTVAAKARMELDPRILIATGALMGSLTDASDENHVFTITQDSMRIASTVSYGVYHQSRAPRTVLPRRPPVALLEKHKKQWVKILQAWLMEAKANANV